MVKGKRKFWYLLGFLIFAFYMLIAARPIPKETILKPRWITSLESNYPDRGKPEFAESTESLPFRLGERYGFVGDDGKFVINQIREAYISLSEKYWAEYDAYPSSIRVMNHLNENVLTIDNPAGYPLFLDDRIFLIGSEQNSITAIGEDGTELWTHDFPAPITCIDASGGFVLAGTLDGAVELLNSSGRAVFSPFEPGGSRLAVILGCAISHDASRLAIISGIDKQRFLLMERAGDTYKVTYHEFLSEGYRRPVNIRFVGNDGKVTFEREGGLGIYDIGSRTSYRVNLEGEIASIDNNGGDRYLFVVTSQGALEKCLITIRYPAFIVSKAPFRSDQVFFTRRGTKLYLGGDSAMASFELEKK